MNFMQLKMESKQSDAGRGLARADGWRAVQQGIPSCQGGVRLRSCRWDVEGRMAGVCPSFGVIVS